MGLLYPGALIFFALVPALVLAYLARERPSRVTVSSVLAFRALRGFRRERFGGWPRLDWMFFAEVLILSLVVLAMASPFIWKRSSPLAVVIDNSAAMQALTPSGKTRFDIAREKLDAELSITSASGELLFQMNGPAIAITTRLRIKISAKNIQSSRGHPPKRSRRKPRSARNASTLETVTRDGRSRARYASTSAGTRAKNMSAPG